MEPTRRPATYENLLAVPDHLVAEIVDGELYVSPLVDRFVGAERQRSGACQSWWPSGDRTAIPPESARTAAWTRSR